MTYDRKNGVRFTCRVCDKTVDVWSESSSRTPAADSYKGVGWVYIAGVHLCPDHASALDEYVAADRDYWSRYREHASPLYSRARDSVEAWKAANGRPDFESYIASARGEKP